MSQSVKRRSFDGQKKSFFLSARIFSRVSEKFQGWYGGDKELLYAQKSEISNAFVGDL